MSRSFVPGRRILSSEIGYLKEIRNGEFEEGSVDLVYTGGGLERKRIQRIESSDDWEPNENEFIPTGGQKQIAHNFAQYLYEHSPWIAMLCEDEDEFIDECVYTFEDILRGEQYNGCRKLIDEKVRNNWRLTDSYIGTQAYNIGDKLLREDYVQDLLDEDIEDFGRDDGAVPRVSTEKWLYNDDLVAKADVFWVDRDKVSLREIKVVYEIKEDHKLQTMANAYLAGRCFPGREVDCKLVNFDLSNGSTLKLRDMDRAEKEIENLISYGKKLSSKVM